MVPSVVLLPSVSRKIRDSSIVTFPEILLSLSHESVMAMPSTAEYEGYTTELKIGDFE